MASIISSLRAAFRSRVGKYYSEEVPYYAGLSMASKAGVNLTESQSLAVSTVYACVYRIASSIASTPVQILRRDGRNVQPVEDNPAQYVISQQPNPEQTAYAFWEYLLAQACMYGKGYAMIERNGQGRPTALIPLNYYEVKQKEVEGTTVFEVDKLGYVALENMLCISNLIGLSPLRLQRDNIGLAKAAQDYGSEFFANGGQMVGILSTEQPLKAQQVEAVQKQWNSSQTTAGTKLLPFGFKYQPITVPPETMAFIETRKLQAEEIARAYQIPAPLIGLGQATYDNLEQQNLLYKQGCLLPWTRRIEQEIDRKLLANFERPETYSKYRLADMYQTDLKARGDFYKTMLQAGVYSINEVRQELDLNDTINGDIHQVPVNTVSLENFAEYSDKISADNAVQ